MYVLNDSKFQIPDRGLCSPSSHGTQRVCPTESPPSRFSSLQSPVSSLDRIRKLAGLGAMPNSVCRGPRPSVPAIGYQSRGYYRLLPGFFGVTQKRCLVPLLRLKNVPSTYTLTYWLYSSYLILSYSYIYNHQIIMDALRFRPCFSHG